MTGELINKLNKSQHLSAFGALTWIRLVCYFENVFVALKKSAETFRVYRR